MLNMAKPTTLFEKAFTLLVVILSDKPKKTISLEYIREFCGTGDEVLDKI